jgi:hypothetical protein
MAKGRAVGQRASLVGAGLAIVAAAASCGGAVADLQPREPRRVSASSEVSRPLPVLPRGVLSLDPCVQPSPPARCAVARDAGSIDGDAGSIGAAGGLLAKGTPASEPPEAAIPKEKSSLLPSGFYNPMPGGVFAGYRADTGLDIAGSPRPVYAIQSGTLDYSEPGHTLWTGPKDTANCVRFKLDTPIPWKGRQITHVYYAHLSKLEYSQAEGSSSRRRIEAGERLGVSGIANHSPHLHIGLLLDGEVEQYWGTFLLEDDVRQVLGNYRNGTRLPRE